jgi:short-subunit dehydrogenase involved in D-alanine esterification of teichoic acids
VKISGKSILMTGGTPGISAASTRYFAELTMVCASNQRDHGSAAVVKR